MAVVAKALIETQQLTIANLTYYTAVNVRTIIDKMTLCNTTSNAISVTIDLVKSGGTAGNVERIISARSISPGETYLCPEAVGHILNTGDSIQGLASSATSITIRASGREISGL